MSCFQATTPITNIYISAASSTVVTKWTRC